MVDSDKPTVVLASGNKHKVEEVSRILASLDVECNIVSMYEACREAGAEVPEIVEDGETFADNALLKANKIAQVTGLAALADDSGITVDALNGMPGIFSARWAGTHGDDEANLQLLLSQLTDVPDERRGAAFECVVALVVPNSDGLPTEFVGHGTVRGSLLRAPRGENGFGYDPIFVPDGHDQTTSEMTADQKDALSHRRRALEELAPNLVKFLS